MTLRASGPEYAPLRTFRDDDLLDPGSDPLIAIIGALSSLNDGERVVARLLLRSMGPEWSQVHQRKLQRQQQPHRPVRQQRPGHPGPDQHQGRRDRWPSWPWPCWWQCGATCGTRTASC